MITSRVILIFYAAICFFVSLHAVSAADAKPARQTQKESAVSAPASVYLYNPRGKADPFKPFMETDMAVIAKRAEEAKQKQAKRVSGALSPLQKDAIAKFILVGIVGDAKSRTAVVEDKAANRHYPIFPGTYIGQNGGRVEAILADRVIVREVVQDGNAKNKKQQFRRIEMLLHNDQ